MTKDVPDFIVIDNDAINNMICNKIIQLTIPDAKVKTFTRPEKGLDYIKTTFPTIDHHVTLLLDISMPGLSGWDVLERFEGFPADVRRQIRVFILTSSVDPLDRERAEQIPVVSGFIVKPLSGVKLQEIFEDFN